MEKAILFINAISEINIEITDLSWWCFVSEGHKPCGMGDQQIVMEMDGLVK